MTKTLKFLLTGAIVFCGAFSIAFMGNTNREIKSTLLLNGKPADDSTLSWAASGKLSLRASVTGRDEYLLFYAYVIRDGKIVDAEAYSHNHAVGEVEMSEMRKNAKDGDLIFIDPVGDKVPERRQKILVRQKSYVPQFNWWPGQSFSKKDGC